LTPRQAARQRARRAEPSGPQRQPYLQLLVPNSAQEPGQLTLSFQLGPEEAIVLIGLTPPPARYFGFYTYRRTLLKPDGTRQSLWTSLGDAVNNATVKTTGPTPFNSPVALIFTPDEKTDGRAASQGSDDSGDRVRGLDMMQRGVDPWGNSPDAVCIVAGYAPEFGSNDEVTLGDDEFLMVYGVNQVSTRRAT
jgi:hypothetical protein